MWWNTIAEGCIDMVNMCNYRNMVEDYRIWSKSAPMLVSLYKLCIKRQVDPREKNGGGSSSWPVCGARGGTGMARALAPALTSLVTRQCRSLHKTGTSSTNYSLTMYG